MLLLDEQLLVVVHNEERTTATTRVCIESANNRMLTHLLTNYKLTSKHRNSQTHRQRHKHTTQFIHNESTQQILAQSKARRRTGADAQLLVLNVAHDRDLGRHVHTATQPTQHFDEVIGLVVDAHPLAVDEDLGGLGDCIRKDALSGGLAIR